MVGEPDLCKLYFAKLFISTYTYPLPIILSAFLKQCYLLKYAVVNEFVKGTHSHAMC